MKADILRSVSKQGLISGIYFTNKKALVLIPTDSTIEFEHKAGVERPVEFIRVCTVDIDYKEETFQGNQSEVIKQAEEHEKYYTDRLNEAVEKHENYFVEQVVEPPSFDHENCDKLIDSRVIHYWQKGLINCAFNAREGGLPSRLVRAPKHIADEIQGIANGHPEALPLTEIWHNPCNGVWSKAFLLDRSAYWAVIAQIEQILEESGSSEANFIELVKDQGVYAVFGPLFVVDQVVQVIAAQNEK